MPNWVTTIIDFESKEDAAKARAFMEEGEGTFDFNKLIPMPKSMDLPSSSILAKAALWYLSERGAKVPNYEECSKYLVHNGHNYASQEDLAKGVEKLLASHEDPTTFDFEAGEEIPISDPEDPTVSLGLYRLGELVVSNIDKYGASDWYDWSCRYWGVKWNASSVYWTDTSVQFDTPWSPPKPIYAAFLYRFDSMPVRIRYAEEQFDLCTGEFVTDGEGMVFVCEPDSGTYEAFRIASYVLEPDQEEHRWDPEQQVIRYLEYGEDDPDFEKCPVIDVEASCITQEDIEHAKEHTRVCDKCNKVMEQGYTDQTGEIHVCDECFKSFMDEEFTDGWRESADGEPNAADGYYEYFDKLNGEWIPLSIYWTEWR